MNQRPITPPTLLASAILRFARNIWNLHRISLILGTSAGLTLAICLIQTEYPTNWLTAFGIALLAHATLAFDLTARAIKAESQP